MQKQRNNGKKTSKSEGRKKGRKKGRREKDKERKNFIWLSLSHSSLSLPLSL
jgi:hypothetical protein